MSAQLDSKSASSESTATKGEKNEFDHTGHRARLKEYYRTNGIDAMRDYEILEMLLFYSVPRRDTRVIARRLLQKYGSIAAVMDAPLEDLADVEGLSENTALILKMIPDLARVYSVSKSENIVQFSSTRDIQDYLCNYFIGVKTECYYMLCLDNAGRLLKCKKMAEGEANSVIVDIKKISIEIATSNAYGIVLAHNHPAGSALPSSADIKVTQKIYTIAKNLGVFLIDHFIFSPTEALSMANSKKFYSGIFRGEHIDYAL